MTYARRDTIYSEGEVYYPVETLLRHVFQNKFLHPEDTGLPDPNNPEFMGCNRTRVRTDCWDGYIFHTEIRNHKLYLIWVQVSSPGNHKSVVCPPEILERLDAYPQTFVSWPLIEIIDPVQSFLSLPGKSLKVYQKSTKKEFWLSFSASGGEVSLWSEVN